MNSGLLFYQLFTENLLDQNNVNVSPLTWNENPWYAQLYGWPPKNLAEVKTTVYTEIKSLQIGMPEIKIHNWNINPNTLTCIQSPNQCLLFNISLQSYSQWKAATNSQWHLATPLPSLGNWDWFSTATSVKTFCLGAYNDTKVTGFEGSNFYRVGFQPCGHYNYQLMSPILYPEVTCDFKTG